MTEDTLTIKLSLDGNTYCALVGENLQEGIAGWGSTPMLALEELVGKIDRDGALSDNGVLKLERKRREFNSVGRMLTDLFLMVMFVVILALVFYCLTGFCPFSRPYYEHLFH